MSSRTANISFDIQPVIIEVTVPYLVLLDPAVLDRHCNGLSSMPSFPNLEPKDAVAALYESEKLHMRIGVHAIPNFRPGRYQLGPSDFRRARSVSDDPTEFDVDSGAVVVVDYARIGVVARLLSWEQYDLALREPGESNPIIDAITEQAGGPCFAIILSVEGTAFDGDGSYKLRKNSPTASHS